MKILWLTSRILPYVANQLNVACTDQGKWLRVLSDAFIKDDNIDFVSIYASGNRIKQKGRNKRCTWYSFYAPKVIETNYNEKRYIFFKNISAKERPDLVHIWGTEYVFSSEMLDASKNIVPAVVSIQGLISECAKKYTEGLPYKVIKSYTFHDLIRNDNILKQKKNFLKRGEFEKDLIRKSNYIIGRTDWDKESVREINPDAEYFFCDEIMRPDFYEGEEWSYTRCDKGRIFMSEASYPIKGMHNAIEIMRILKKKHPNIHLYTTGRDARSHNIQEIMRQNSYEKYLSTLINEYGLNENITYLGRLGPAEIKEQLLKANLYLNISVVENSSNSIAEAMLIGTPILASDVGGTSSIVGTYGRECLFDIERPQDAAGMAERILNKEKPEDFLKYLSVRQYAKEKYDVNKILSQYLDCYANIIGKTK